MPRPRSLVQKSLQLLWSSFLFYASVSPFEKFTLCLDYETLKIVFLFNIQDRGILYFPLRICCVLIGIRQYFLNV
jgi:hypothetical protein